MAETPSTRFRRDSSNGLTRRLDRARVETAPTVPPFWGLRQQPGINQDTNVLGYGRLAHLELGGELHGATVAMHAGHTGSPSCWIRNWRTRSGLRLLAGTSNLRRLGATTPDIFFHPNNPSTRKDAPRRLRAPREVELDSDDPSAWNWDQSGIEQWSH